MRRRRALAELAAFLGIQRSYHDAMGVRRRASDDAVEATIAALLGGEPRNPGATLRRLEAEGAKRLVEPVRVVWVPGRRSLRLNAEARAASSIECVLEGEDLTHEWRIDTEALRSLRAAAEAGPELPLPVIEPGYYTLHLSARGPSKRVRRASSLVIAAPSRAYRDPAISRDWGAFLPLYALHSRQSWGAGDFSDLAALATWVRGLGGAVLATLPLLAGFLGDAPFDPSPYSPASRLMWNEVYIDVQRLPELAQSEKARALVASPAFQDELASLRSERLVDYQRLAALKGSVLLELSAAVSGGRARELRAFLEEKPEVESYARFRARTERHGAFATWPESTDGAGAPDFDKAVSAYHAYAQWVAERQLAEAAGRPEAAGLYLDLPLGVHGAGFDVWRWPECFVRGAAAGAPPDPLALGGQNWGFPPLHPAGNREQHYAYVIAFIRHHLRYASRLRIDHVMGLHRLFMIPHGFESHEGVYVRYPAEELYAILSLESHRHKAEIAGENLGTVPHYVNPALRRHQISGTYILPFELQGDRDPPIRPPQPGDVAALNTHDLRPFALWWAEEDWSREAILRYLEHKGLLPPGARDDDGAVLQALLAYMGRSDARSVIASLEDLWLETERQNVPGTTVLPNWRRKARYSLEEMQALPEVAARLQALDGARRATTSQDSR